MLEGCDKGTGSTLRVCVLMFVVLRNDDEGKSVFFFFY